MPTRAREQLILEIMITSSTDFRERITGEITDFIQNQERALSLTAIERLIADLPTLRERFAKIPTQSTPALKAIQNQRYSNCSLEFLRRISRRRRSAQRGVESISEYVEQRAALLTLEHLSPRLNNPTKRPG